MPWHLHIENLKISFFNLFYEFCIYEHLHDFCVFVVILSRYYFTNILFKYAWMTAFELDDNY